MNNWKNFTEDNLPPQHTQFQLNYKDMLWNCTMDGTKIEGVSPLGEVRLYTTIERILTHDKENEEVSKWRT